MYRILTERKNVERVMRMLRHLRVDYTVYVGDGAWHGTPEASMAIELDRIGWNKVLFVAKLIKALNAQQAVLIQIIPVQSVLI